MTMRFMNPKNMDNMLRLIEEKVPPPLEITLLKEEIERKINAAEVKTSVTSEIDEDEVMQIIALKFRLDTLYGKWCEGKL